MLRNTGQVRRPFQDPSRSEALAYEVASSCSPHDAGRLAAALVACADDPVAYEASVRASRTTPLRAGRMMIEQASPAVVAAIADALGVTMPASAERWMALAHQERLPIIAGWDRRSGGADACVKLYVNASDAAVSVRERICTTLAPGVAARSETPAVIGLNARRDGGTEIKLYVQSADAVACARDLAPHARALADAARSEGADAGGVLSFDAADGALHPRAFFVALREPLADNEWQCVRTLPGYDRQRVAALLPFPPAAPRSVGVSLSDDSWTLYCKPRHSGRAPEALEPVATFSSGDVEVGVFVEPTEHAVRAFRRTDRHAVSVRVRAGTLAPQAIESLVDWFTDRLRSAERDAAPITSRLDTPPAPWRLVAVTEPQRVGADS